MSKPACAIVRPQATPLAVLAMLLLGLSASAIAIDLDAIRVYDRQSHSRAVTDCDHQAAHPDDPEAVAAGVGRAAMDLAAAAAACRAALADDPDNPRLHYQLARSLGYAGRHAEAEPHRLAALQAGYPQSLFVIGYIRLTGWDGAEPDPCLGGELIRRSAQAGRYAGLVGFPHYYLMGQFTDCAEHPRIERAEMLGFLDQAATDDFYRGALVEQLRARLIAQAETER